MRDEIIFSTGETKDIMSNTSGTGHWKTHARNLAAKAANVPRDAKPGPPKLNKIDPFFCSATAGTRSS
jgi:hypothetical protein